MVDCGGSQKAGSSKLANKEGYEGRKNSQQKLTKQSPMIQISN